MPDIIHEVVLLGSPEQVYYNLTEQPGLAAWWTKHTQAAPVVGSDASFAFDRGAVTFTMRVEELRVPALVKWRCIAGPPEWVGTTVAFELSPTPEGSTRLNFRHLGFRSTEGGLGRYSYSWAGYLWSLKELVEKSEGHPYEDPPLP
jgi:uncharacterized protein YndB with AHSA1/START domain